MNLVRYKRRYYCDFGFDPSVKTSLSGEGKGR